MVIIFIRIYMAFLYAFSFPHNIICLGNQSRTKRHQELFIYHLLFIKMKTF